jgi:hypothetical protein
MSREVRRVPLDFNQPIGQVWPGYLMPDDLDLPECPDCKHGTERSTGYSLPAWGMTQTFYSHQFYGMPRDVQDRLAWRDKISQDEVDNLLANSYLRTWVPNPDGGRGRWEALPRTAEEVNASQRGLNGHDSGAMHTLVRYRCERLGLPFYCDTCHGDGHLGTPEQVAAQEAWEPTDPPVGDGWQLWETTTEGSPKSPIYATSAELVDWMTTHPCGFAGHAMTREAAEYLVSGGYAPSMVAVGGELLDGPEAMARKVQS